MHCDLSTRPDACRDHQDVPGHGAPQPLQAPSELKSGGERRAPSKQGSFSRFLGGTRGFSLASLPRLGSIMMSASVVNLAAGSQPCPTRSNAGPRYHHAPPSLQLVASMSSHILANELYPFLFTEDTDYAVQGTPWS